MKKEDPWQLVPLYSGMFPCRIQKGEEIIAYPVDMRYNTLITCAPEMRNELIKIFRTIYNTQDECYWLPIYNVIQKATGLSLKELIGDYEI